MAAPLPKDGRRSATGRSVAREGYEERDDGEQEKDGEEDSGENRGERKDDWESFEDAAHRRRQLARQGSGARRSRALETEKSQSCIRSRSRRRARGFYSQTMLGVDAHPRQSAQ